MRWWQFEIVMEDGTRLEDRVVGEAREDAEALLRRVYPRHRYFVLQGTTFESQVNRDLARKRAQQAPGPLPPPPAPPPPPPRAAAPAWTAVLGVASTATAAEVKRAYLGLVRKYHPDRVADLGDELVALAERKMTEINQAYEEACRALAGR